MSTDTASPLAGTRRESLLHGELGAEHRARELIVFADGLEEGGFPDYARRSRTVARDLLDALDALAAERSARVAPQARCEQQQELLARRAYEAMT